MTNVRWIYLLRHVQMIAWSGFTLKIVAETVIYLTNLVMFVIRRTVTEHIHYELKVVPAHDHYTD
jgi:hypothetical protein